MNYTRLYEQDDAAAAAGSTTVGNSGLGMTPAERASVPSSSSRKKKKSKKGVNPLMKPAAMGETVEP